MWPIFRPKDVVMNYSQHYELTRPNVITGDMEFTNKWDNTDVVTVHIGEANPRSSSTYLSAAYYEGNIEIRYIAGDIS